MGVGRRTVGMATIGQAPRDDVTALFRRRLLPETRLIERGALDELSDRAIQDLAPHEGEPVLVSLLRDGREVALSKPRLEPFVQAALDALEWAGATVTVLLCTGEFPSLKTNGLLVNAGSLSHGMVDALSAGRHLGIIVPTPAQVVGPSAASGRRWLARDVTVTWASPYSEGSAGRGQWQQAVQELGAASVDLVFLDCMGMTEQHRQAVESSLGRPALLAGALVAGTVAELLETAPPAVQQMVAARR